MKKVGDFFAGFTSVIYFIVIFIMMILLFLSNVFSENYYTNILNNIDLSDIKLADLGIYDDEFRSDATVQDILIESLEEAGISENDAIKIINNKKINEVAGKFISDTIVYITDNEEIPQINYQDIKEIIRSDNISRVLEETPSDEEIKQFVNELNIAIAESFEEGI